MSIKYTGSDSRSYPDAGSMIRAGVDEIVSETYNKVERAITRTICKAHGKSPSVSRQQRGGTVRFEIASCCEENKADAEAAARRAMA